MLQVLKGNIFTTKCQTIVNTINCVGVMGAGIAYECRLRFPEMYSKYVELCESGNIKIGSLWIYKSEEKWVLNFPTKTHWKFQSKIEYLELGLNKFVHTYRERGITSIAFPLLGASNGGISESLSLEIMERFLSRCDIPIEIYKYDPTANDDLFLNFKTLWQSKNDKQLAEMSKLRADFVKKLRNAFERDDIKTISGLLTINGIGDKTLEKAFKLIRELPYNTEDLDLFS